MNRVTVFSTALLSACTMATTTQPSSQTPRQENTTTGSIQVRSTQESPNANATRHLAQKLVIDAPMTAPRFITVTLQPNRQKLSEEVSGDNCHDIALPTQPDVVIEVERPIDGLVIRPLPSLVPIVLRTANSTDPEYRECVDSPLDKLSENLSLDRFMATSEFHSEDAVEGTLSISLGTADATTPATVTLMIYDASSKFSPLDVVSFGGEVPTFEQRWVAHQMPQIDISKIGTDTYTQLSHSADVFAAIPRQALLYAKFDFDDAIVAGGSSPHFPKKNEPLVLLNAGQEHAIVLAADGMQYYVKNKKHLVQGPRGAKHVVSVPRELKMESSPSDLIKLLPPSQMHLALAYRKELKGREECKDRAWKPFRKRLPTVAWGRRITYKSAQYVRIENAGRAAVIRKCGSKESIAKKEAKTATSFQAAIAQGRVDLLKRATGNLK